MNMLYCPDCRRTVAAACVASNCHFSWPAMFEREIERVREAERMKACQAALRDLAEELRRAEGDGLPTSYGGTD